MSALSPLLQDVQKRHSDPRRRSEEQMKLYREAGINPVGCFSSMLLQFPILIALYRTFSVAVGEAPEALIKAPNLVLSPHIGGRSPESVAAARNQISQNLKAHFAGGQVKHRVN